VQFLAEATLGASVDGIDELLNATKIDFAVVSVPWEIAPIRTMDRTFIV
jgi:hypothetical protein